MGDGTCLENRRALRPWGFDSLTLRYPKNPNEGRSLQVAVTHPPVNDKEGGRAYGSIPSPLTVPLTKTAEAMNKTLLYRLGAYLGACYEQAALTAVGRFWGHRNLHVLLRHFL